MRTRFVLKTASLTTVLVVALLLSGCGGSGSGGGGGGGGNTDTPFPPTASSQANVISGTAVDTQGNPLPGVDISIVGIARASGQQIKYDNIQTDANGVYSVPVSNGTYTVFADYSVNYEGVQWSLPLHPTDNSDQPQDSTNGISKNFEWKIEGAQPGADGTQYADYYGVTLSVNLSVLSSLPDGATFTFTLTPNGALIDGSTGQPLTFTRTPQDLSTMAGTGQPLDHTDDLYDIPIGDYTITGQVTGSDGNTQAVSFDGNSSEEVSWAGKSEPTVHLVDLLYVNISVG